MFVESELNQAKLERQILGRTKFYQAGARGTLWYPTGFGKTMCGKLIYEPFLDKNVDKVDYTVTILAPSVEIVKGWEKETKPDYLSKTFMYSADQVLNNDAVIETTLLIVDEIDTFLSDERFSLIDGTKIKYKYILGLTANYEDRHGRHKKLENIAPCVDHIPEQEALDNGWISRFIEYNIGIEFDDSYMFKTVHIKHDDDTAEDVPMTKSEYYEFISKTIQKLNSKFGEYGIKLAEKVLYGYKGPNKEGEQVDIPGIGFARKLAMNYGWHGDLNLNDDHDKMIDDQWNPGKLIGYAKNLFEAIQTRKKFLYNAVEKLPIAVQIIEKFDNCKTISFAESTDYADALCELLNKGKDKPLCTVYHSNIKSRPLIDPETGTYYVYSTGKRKGEPKIFGKKKLKEFAVNAIKSGSCRVVSTASALDRGFNVEDIALGINNSRTSSYQKHNQRGGRTKRVNPFQKDKVGLIVNLYMRYTKEEEWLRQAQSKNSNTVYWINSVEQISYKPKSKYEINFELF